MELDVRAERLLDARATRRLVDLEIRDVRVPSAPDQSETALFFRVLGEDGGRVRIELWERGELHGIRVVSAADGGRSLSARRVALAAAELARLLRTTRLRAAQAAEREQAVLAARARAERERTLDGPVALRSSASAEIASGTDLFLAGPALSLELSAKPLGRVDLGLGLRGGALTDGDVTAESIELELAFARRFVLSKTLDLDAGAGVRAGLLSLGGVREVDSIGGQAQTWWSRAFLSVRIEPRVSREVRFGAGVLGGLLLRRVPFAIEAGSPRELEGSWLGVELGFVFTPESR